MRSSYQAEMIEIEKRMVILQAVRYWAISPCNAVFYVHPQISQPKCTLRTIVVASNMRNRCHPGTTLKRRRRRQSAGAKMLQPRASAPAMSHRREARPPSLRIPRQQSGAAESSGSRSLQAPRRRAATAPRPAVRIPRRPASRAGEQPAPPPAPGGATAGAHACERIRRRRPRAGVRAEARHAAQASETSRHVESQSQSELVSPPRRARRHLRRFHRHSRARTRTGRSASPRPRASRPALAAAGLRTRPCPLLPPFPQ